MNNLRKISIFTVVVFAAIWVSACNLSDSGTLEVGKMRVREQYVTKSYDLYRFDSSAAGMIVNDVMKNNNTDVVLNVSYLKGDESNQSLMKQEAKTIQTKLIAMGLNSVKLEMVPVEDSKNVGKLIIYYKSKVALAPKGCSEMLGRNGAVGMDDLENYSIGCSHKTVFSRMIADPNDLLGEEKYAGVDSRRAGTTVEQYKAGVPNEQIQGMNASQLGN